MQHIETIELGSSQSSIVVDNISGDYNDLLLTFSMRTVGGTSERRSLLMDINNTDTNRSQVFLRGDGSSVVAGTGSTAFVCRINSGATTANTFSSGQIYFSNYADSNFKSWSTESVLENNATASAQFLIADLWSSSSAITKLEFYSDTGETLDTGCSISLYGVTAGGDGTVTTS